MSWMNCDICGKYKYVPEMVKFTSVFSEVSLTICPTCLGVGEVKKEHAVFWLPCVTYKDVEEEGESVDPKKDLTPVPKLSGCSSIGGTQACR